jgi:DNA polymerase-1
MMFVLGDFKQLEWNTCAFLSQDAFAIAELNTEGVDLHQENQSVLGLPSRLIAKKFLFRLIFGGSAWAYAHDPEFYEVSKDQKYWQKIIDKFYQKYSGVHQWHQNLMLEAMNTGRITLPTGKFFPFSPTQRNGEFIWPRTTILNYPVQGLGADLMALARLLLNHQLTKNSLSGKMVETVHDSIMVDCPKDEFPRVVELFHKVWDLIPKMFERLYGIPYNIKCIVSVKHGQTWGTLTKEDKNAD